MCGNAVHALSRKGRGHLRHRRARGTAVSYVLKLAPMRTGPAMTWRGSIITKSWYNSGVRLLIRDAAGQLLRRLGDRRGAVHADVVVDVIVPIGDDHAAVDGADLDIVGDSRQPRDEHPRCRAVGEQACAVQS